MTNKEAKVFLDNLKICIDEHPVVADWLVEIADRKTEPTISKMEQVEDEPSAECKRCKHFKYRPNCGLECEYDTFEECNYEPKDEPQTDCAWK